MNSKFCLACNTEFQTTHFKKVYCSRRCNNKHYRGKYKITQPNKYLEQKQNWRDKNKGKIAGYKRKYRQNVLSKRKKTDTVFVLKTKLRQAIRRYAFSKATIEIQWLNDILQCTRKEFKQHLFSNIDLNTKDLHIDHIVPLKNAKNEQDVFSLNCYKNLQLLSAQYNLKKATQIANKTP